MITLLLHWTSSENVVADLTVPSSGCTPESWGSLFLFLQTKDRPLHPPMIFQDGILDPAANVAWNSKSCWDPINISQYSQHFRSSPTLSLSLYSLYGSLALARSGGTCHHFQETLLVILIHLSLPVWSMLHDCTWERERRRGWATSGTCGRPRAGRTEKQFLVFALIWKKKLIKWWKLDFLFALTTFYYYI